MISVGAYLFLVFSDLTCHLEGTRMSEWAYLSIFNLFKFNELWPYYQKHVNQIILNHITL